jgi:hypothetical protein
MLRPPPPNPPHRATTGRSLSREAACVSLYLLPLMAPPRVSCWAAALEEAPGEGRGLKAEGCADIGRPVNSTACCSLLPAAASCRQHSTAYTAQHSALWLCALGVIGAVSHINIRTTPRSLNPSCHEPAVLIVEPVQIQQLQYHLCLSAGTLSPRQRYNSTTTWRLPGGSCTGRRRRCCGC